VPLEQATAYAAEDADVTLRLWLLCARSCWGKKALALYEQWSAG
jgi:DNA polymerase-1